MTAATPFVGREPELQALMDALWEAAAGRGSMVVVEGGAGDGKTLLVRELLARARALSALQGARVATGYCYEGTGPHSAYQPFIDLLDTLSKAPDGGWRKALRTARTVITETAPDWLQAVPVVGPLLGAGAKTATLTTRLLAGDADAEARGDTLAREYARTLLRVAQESPLLLLVIEDAHWIDHASCDLLLRLAREIGASRMLIVLTCRPGGARENDPLLRVRSGTAAAGCARMLALGRLAEREVAEYLEARFGTDFFPAFAPWLLQLCSTPLFMTQYLNLLEQEQIIYRRDGAFVVDGRAEKRDGEWVLTGRLADLPLSGDIDTLLDRRVQGLMQAERNLLLMGSVQGERFGSMVLARLARTAELDVLRQLREVSERHRIISLYTGRNWMRGRSEVYAFEHFLTHQAFYRKLTPHERRLYHGEIAAFLRQIADVEPAPPRKLLLEVAHHWRLAGEHLDAARYSCLAAKSSYADGAIVDAAHLCEEGLASLRQMDAEHPERDPLIAECALLHLMCALYGPLSREANLDLMKVVAEGEAAAARIGAHATRTQIRSIRGQMLIRLGQVHDALAVMREAVELARAEGDCASEFFALVQLGKDLAKENLEEAMVLRYNAERVYREQSALPGLTDEQREGMARQYAVLLIYIGVGELDRGDYERALRYLQPGMERLRERRMHDALLAGLNYTGQAYARLGQFAQAERAIRQALALGAEYDADAVHPWIGYNHGYLAKLYLDRGRYGEAAVAMAEAVRITDATEHADLATLVRNYHAELLLAEGYAGADAQAAERILVQNGEASRQAGLYRSVAKAHTLLALLRLREGRVDDALRESTAALQVVEQWGSLPALRTEEVLYNHARVLAAAGRAADAHAMLARAHGVIRAQGARITDPALAHSFYHEVPLNRRIARDYESSRSTPTAHAE